MGTLTRAARRPRPRGRGKELAVTNDDDDDDATPPRRARAREGARVMGWGKKKKKPSAADDAAAAGGRLESAEEPAVVDASASANDAASRSSSKKSSSSSSGGGGASKARTKGAKLLRASEIGEALAVLEEGLDESPHDSVALHALIARCHVANQDWEAATDHFVAALDDAGDAMNLDASNRNSNNPLDAEFFYAMGDAAFRRGMHPECAFAYESALEFGEKRIPKSVSISLVHFHLGATRRALGDHDAARESFAKVTNPLEVSLARADLKCEEAACFEAMGLVEEAERCVREAGEDPSGPPVKARSVITLVPIRPRRRGERRSLRTLPPGDFSPPRVPRFQSRRTHLDARLSTPLLTPFNSTPTFKRSYGTTPRRRTCRKWRGRGGAITRTAQTRRRARSRT